MDMLAAILSSAVAGGLFSGFFTLYISERNYRNEYYKMIVDRRLTAHEQINRLVNDLKTSIPDTDGKTYHRIFGLDKEQYHVFVASARP